MTMSRPVCESWFSTQKISDRLYLITEPHYCWSNRANLWLIKGQTQDLLLATGLGVSSLRRYIASLLDKPLLAIASHIHFDHAGGMHEFDHRAIHAAEASALRMGDDFEALCSKGQGWIQQDHFDCSPYDGFTVDTYTLNPAEPTQILNDGDVLDLGDRAFEVLHLPGHSPGCIALYDPQAKELFSGDVVYDGELLDGLHCSHIPTYLKTFERLERLSVETMYPGHYSIVGNARYRQLISEYLDAKRQPGCPSEMAVAKG